ncbi:MAG: acyltransferase [Bacteroidales bacterium]|jgi:phenylacetate-coenzyme A ligase PaaK-like adenylate-forming protein|nr:acyltransferase [Bacteroidales bacterium]
MQAGIFRISDPDSFNELALEIFRYQAGRNRVYSRYLEHLGTDIMAIDDCSGIPFLPIGFFKTEKVITGDFNEEAIFSSSGTTGMLPARHFVKDLNIYHESFLKGFRMVYGDPAEYRILALLPSYLERKGSSLVYMVDSLIKQGNHPESGFFLDDLDLLAEILRRCSHSKVKTLLIGVSFALLDLAEKFSFPMGDNIIIMETGGMKGRREEITREELHASLKEAFGIKNVHTEYGMTELLSQAYAIADGNLVCPPWMKVMIRDIQDPFSLFPPGKTGAINIIDLANIHSCAFIETQDMGKLHPDGSFEVLGRTDHSDIRGCSLLIQ